MFESLDIVILSVSDLEASKKFYRQTFGMRVKNQSPGWVEFKLGETSVALCAESQELADPRKVKWGHELSFKVDDVNKAYEYLKSRGVHFLVKPHDEPFGRHAQFCDPDGHVFSITQRKGKQEAGVR